MGKMTCDALNISQPIYELCEIFGLDVRDVFSIELGVSHARVKAHLRNDEGSKYIEDDSGFPADETHLFRIETKKL